MIKLPFFVPPFVSLVLIIFSEKFGFSPSSFVFSFYDVEHIDVENFISAMKLIDYMIIGIVFYSIQQLFIKIFGESPLNIYCISKNKDFDLVLKNDNPEEITIHFKVDVGKKVSPFQRVTLIVPDAEIRNAKDNDLINKKSGRITFKIGEAMKDKSSCTYKLVVTKKISSKSAFKGQSRIVAGMLVMRKFRGTHLPMDVRFKESGE